ncbi:MAG TPA: N4-gp56 family major capsid protein [Marmoricola sp.]
MAVPQTLAGMSAAQRNAYNMVLLQRALPYTPMFGSFGGSQKASIAKHQGTTMEWRVYGGTTVATTGAGLALATTALTEGVPPAETAITAAKVTKAVLQYGAWVKLSDLLVHQGIDPIWAEAYALLGEQAGQTLHTLLINDLAGGTNVQYAGAATSRVTVASTMILNGAEIREAVRTLKRAKVPRFGDGFYHGLIHPDQSYDLQNDADWKNMNVYNGGSANNGNSLVKGTIGALHGVLFEESTDAPFFAGAGATGANVYAALIYAPRWFGTVGLEAQPTASVTDQGDSGIRISGVPVETPTKDDALGQFGVAGWKTSYGAKILREWVGLRIETGATA